MSNLGLQPLAARHFDYLISERGYKCAESTPYRVRFESPTVFIELVYDGNRSYELGLLIGKLGSQNPPFTIDEILRLRCAPEADSFSMVQVATNEALAVWVEKLAVVLQTFAGDFIAGSENSFVEITEQRRKDVQNYALERDLQAARAEAEEAWRKKDYLSVVKALKPLRSALTATEVGKLEFAENQCSR